VTDVLIRDVPDDVIDAVDAHAQQLGLSRSEYLRRQLAREIAWSTEMVSIEDLRLVAETFTDLGDSTVMNQAWR